MHNLKFFRNLVIAIVGIFIVFFVLSIVKEDTDNQNTNDTVKDSQATTTTDLKVPTEISLKSEKGINIFITYPKEDILSTSPMKISGRAPGTWFFEANMPITLTNWDGLIIAEGNVKATSDWMTTEYVPFEGELEFKNTDYGNKGFLIIRKDNPSGLSKFDDSVEMMVKLD